MLFSEFQKGTGCKNNEHNQKVYRDLDIMYMNSDMSKEEIYEYGRKLMDNSKTDEQIALEVKVKAEIGAYKEAIKSEKMSMDYFKSVGNKFMVSYHRDMIRRYKEKIRALRWVIA